VFLILFLCILAPILGLFGIQLAQPLADIAALLLAIPIQIRVLKEMKELEIV
jgi:hypothetical protein